MVIHVFLDLNRSGSKQPIDIVVYIRMYIVHWSVQLRLGVCEGIEVTFLFVK